MAKEKVYCVKTLKCDAGHRIFGHENKCANLHGHEYFFKLYVKRITNDTDSIGRALDFSVVKSIVGQWIDTNWDHGMILNVVDPLTQWFTSRVVVDSGMRVISPFYGNKVYIMKVNPTAENLARRLKSVANELLAKYGVKVFKVKCRETHTSDAVCVDEEDSNE